MLISVLLVHDWCFGIVWHQNAGMPLLLLVHFLVAPSAGDISSCNTLRSVYLGVLCRLISVSFLIRTPGKETNIEPPLRLEKNGKINFSLWKQVNRPHLDPMTSHAKGAEELFRFFPSIILALASHFLLVKRVKRKLDRKKYRQWISIKTVLKSGLWRGK